MFVYHRNFYRPIAVAFLLASAPFGHAAFAADDMLAAAPAMAAEDASAFIVQLGQQAITTMTNNAISTNNRVLRFAAIVDRDFDVPKIAKFMLGRYWQGATETERADFTDVFRDFMIRVYSDNFSKYNGDSFRVIDQRVESEAVTIVRTNITPTGSSQAMPIEWRVVKTLDGYKVNDLNVGGVSLAVAQQAEFGSAIQRNGGQVSILIKQVRSKLTQLETAGQ